MAKRIEDDPGDWIDMPTIGTDTTDPGDWVDVPVDQEPQTNLAEQLVGGVTKGFMRLGRAALGAPATAVRQAGLIRQWSFAEDVLREQDPVRQAELRKGMSESKQSFNATAKALGEAQDWHKQGVETILKNHPEWESEPPESFVDLVKSPDKLAVALAEAMPLLLAAGILTAAGQPSVAAGLMYVSEGQEASDQAIADGASEDDAAIAYGVYGVVAGALETMQLKGLIKVAKGSYNALLNRTVQKVAKGGLRTAAWGTIKTAAQEALEEMSQGAWGEITAKMVYDKDIPGGVVDFIDRRAQEAYVGFVMGVVAGGVGGVAGRVQGGREVSAVEDISNITPTPIPESEITLDKFSGTIEANNLPPVKKGDLRLYRGFSGETREGGGTFYTPFLQHAFQYAKYRRDEYGGKGGLAYIDVPHDAANKFASSKVNEEYLGLENVALEYVFPDLAQPAPTVETPPVEVPTGEAQVVEPTSKQPKRSVITDQAIKEAVSGIFGETTELPITKDLDLEQTLAEPTPKPTPVTRKKALTLGHILPDLLEWDETKRRDFMQQTVGQTTMKGMKLADMRTLVDALQGEVRAVGLEYTAPTPPVEELVSTLEETKKVTELDPAEEFRVGKVRQLGRKIKAGVYSFTTGLERMERFFESLDGHKAGAFKENLWKPIQQADELSTEFANQDLDEFMGSLEDQGIDTAVWLGKTEDIGRWSLTPFQKVGTYMLAQNKTGKRQLTKGMGMSDTELARIMDAMTPQETNMAEWLLEKYDQQWDVIKTVAVQSGIDPTKLKKELRYSPIMRTDADLETQEDFLSGIIEGFTNEGYDPEHKFLQERKPGAAGKVELDAAILYMHNIARTQRFIQFAPVANKIGKILNDKKFKQALNERTYGQGSKLVNKWMKDSVRGTTAHTTGWLSKVANIARRNGIIYAIGFNIPSSLRQSLSLSNAVAVDKAMLVHVPANLARATTPKGYKEMEEFVFSRSLQVKNSSFDRDLRTKANKAGLKLKLRGKQQWSQKAISWIRWMDKHTRVVAWKSLYDTGMGKFDNEAKAMEYADKWVARTQPMANMKDLPDFFRGGTFEKLITTFQNQVNNNANFYIYDILGAKKAGEISTTDVAHRVMFSYVLPSIMFGMIGRGGLPKDWKDVAVDLATYPLAGAVVIGRWITQMIKGWGDSSSVAGIAPGEAGKLIGAAKRGDIKDIIKYAASTVGAATGRIPAQAIRTAEGVIDIATGETEDPRRLIYSEWALKQGKKKKKKTKYGGGF